MKLYAVFLRGAPKIEVAAKKGGTRGNCFIRLTQYPPVIPVTTS